MKPIDAIRQQIAERFAEIRKPEPPVLPNGPKPQGPSKTLDDNRLMQALVRSAMKGRP